MERALYGPLEELSYKGFRRYRAVDALRENDIPFSIVHIDLLYVRKPTENTKKLYAGEIKYKIWEADTIENVVLQELGKDSRLHGPIILTTRKGKEILRCEPEDIFNEEYGHGFDELSYLGIFNSLGKIPTRDLGDEAKKWKQLLNDCIRKYKNTTDFTLAVISELLDLGKTPDELIRQTLDWDIDVGRLKPSGHYFVKQWNTAPQKVYTDPRFLLTLSIAPSVFGARRERKVYTIFGDQVGYNFLPEGEKVSNLLIQDHSRDIEAKNDFTNVKRRIAEVIYERLTGVTDFEKALETVNILSRANPSRRQNRYKNLNPLVP